MTLLWAPLLLLLALVPALIGLYLVAQRRRGRAAVRYSSLSLVAAARPGSSRIRRHLPFALFAASIGAIVVALARPAAVVSVPTNQTTILMVMDVSRSMCSTDISPSRLVAAQEAAAEFIDRQDPGTSIGLVAFAGFAELVQPPTSDRQMLLDAVWSLTTGRRTAVGSGILTAIDAIAEIDPTVAPAVTAFSPGVPPEPVVAGAYRPAIIVVLTDGASNAGAEPLEAAKQAADRGLRVYTIGCGTANGDEFDPACGAGQIGREPNDPAAGGGSGIGGGGGFGGGGGLGGGGGGGFRRGIDEDTLREVAAVTGGEYHPAESASELVAVFDGLPTALITRHEVVELSAAFVGLGALLVVLSIGLSPLWRPLP
jgi:Ca-activated chloride channel family protein